jgi:fructokinase
LRQANHSNDAPYVGAIEGGGTKFVCAIAHSPQEIIERTVVPTTTASETLRQCVEFFEQAALHYGAIKALGVACFGPLQLRRGAPDYGCLLPTPKAGWSGVNLVSTLQQALHVRVALDTDVGAAAKAELQYDAAQGLGSVAYVTVGTGIGGAVAPAGADTTRLMHAEMGHLTVRRHADDQTFTGICPFHGDCLEGLASGPAILKRWGCDLSSLPTDHIGRQIIASYLAQLAATIALFHGVQRLVFGGGVLSDELLLPRIRSATAATLNGYFPPLRDNVSMEAWIQAPALGADAAIAGALLMALEIA